MHSIMTLSLEQFNFIDDLLSLMMVMLGGGALFLFLSNSAVLRTLRPAIIALGVAMTIGGYYYFRLFESWNEAFELAGISYAVSGHPFREAYRYSAWLIIAPLLIMVLCSALGQVRKGCRHLVFRAIIVSEVMMLCGYLMTLVTQSRSTSLLLAIGMIVAFAYLGFLFYKKIPALLLQQDLAAVMLFQRARNILFTTWFLSRGLLLLSSMNALQTPSVLIFTITAFALLDLIALGGVGFYAYLAIVQVSLREEK